MLEGLAAWVLNTYVGEYVENVNTAQLSIALLQGAVELENLPLKKDALKSFDIPIEVKPATRDILYLQCDKEQEKMNEDAEKKVMLDALEDKWKVLRQNAVVDSSNASWFSYGASMAANVLENIQLKVKDMHIRYEDDTLNPQCPFAVGIVIKNLSAQSTDASWNKKSKT